MLPCARRSEENIGVADVKKERVVMEGKTRMDRDALLSKCKDGTTEQECRKHVGSLLPSAPEEVKSDGLFCANVSECGNTFVHGPQRQTIIVAGGSDVDDANVIGGNGEILLLEGDDQDSVLSVGSYDIEGDVEINRIPNFPSGRILHDDDDRGKACAASKETEDPKIEPVEEQRGKHNSPFCHISSHVVSEEEFKGQAASPASVSRREPVKAISEENKLLSPEKGSVDMLHSVAVKTTVESVEIPRVASEQEERSQYVEANCVHEKKLPSQVEVRSVSTKRQGTFEDVWEKTSTGGEGEGCELSRPNYRLQCENTNKNKKRENVTYVGGQDQTTHTPSSCTTLDASLSEVGRSSPFCCRLCRVCFSCTL
jgi:hypothetical protein